MATATEVTDYTEIPLNRLAPGQGGRICGINADNKLSKRLYQMGIIEGETIKVVRRAPGGDPLECCLMGYHLSLRSQESYAVLVLISIQHGLRKKRRWGMFRGG